MSTRAALLLGSAALLALASAGAASAQVDRPDVKYDAWGRPLVVLGWTAAGDYFVYTRQVEYYPLETVDDESVVPLRLIFGVAHEARTGRVRRYVLELTDENGRPVVRDEFSGSPGLIEWTAWLAEHPLSMPRGRVSASGARARVTGTAQSGGAVVMWDGRQFRYNLPGGKPVRLVLQIDVLGRRWTSLATGDGDRTFVGTAEPLWSPDGRRVAWRVEEASAGDDGPTGNIVIAAVGPRVQLNVADDAEAQAPNALEHLEGAGIAPVMIKRATAPLEHTTIRAAAGLELDAHRLAELLPGKAVVEPMTAPSSYDLIVLAGPELMVPRAPPVETLEAIGEDGTGPGRRWADGPGTRRMCSGAGVAVGAAAAAYVWMRLLAWRARRRRG